ncbi:MAG: hypothetical protein PVI03_06090 [Candidatus Thorarchaeota archaeon]|jgi:hypothetical protein
MMRINRSVLAGLGIVVVVLIVFTVMWILDITSLGGIMGAIGGMIGGVLGATYMQRFHDERFSQIMKKSGSNAYWFIVIALPLSWIVIAQAETITMQLAVGLTFVIWMLSFVIYYLSLFYYYKR